MAIQAICGGCQRKYTFQETHAGRTFRCKDCDALVKVPSREKAAPQDYEEEDLDEAPRRRSNSTRKAGSSKLTGSSKQKKKKRKNQQTLYWSVGVGGLLLLAMMLLFSGSGGDEAAPIGEAPAMNGGLADVRKSAGAASSGARSLTNEQPYSFHPFIPYRRFANREYAINELAGRLPTEMIDIPNFSDLEAVSAPNYPGIAVYNARAMPASAEQTTLPGAHTSLRLMMPTGDHATGALGCVFVGPAGTNLVSGSAIDEFDGELSPEHLPYVEAGFAVVTFSLDGPIADREQATLQDFQVAFRDFSRAFGGVINARNAIEFVLRKVPQVSPERLYVAGHSSAGTLSLLMAAHEPRVKGVISFAAETDIKHHLREFLSQSGVDAAMPGLTQFAERGSPRSHRFYMSCPIFLFHAADDPVVTYSVSQSLAGELKIAGNQNVSCVIYAHGGGHYEPMISAGIPQAIAWLKSLPSETAVTPASPPES